MEKIGGNFKVSQLSTSPFKSIPHPSKRAEVSRLLQCTPSTSSSKIFTRWKNIQEIRTMTTWINSSKTEATNISSFWKKYYGLYTLTAISQFLLGFLIILQVPTNDLIWYKLFNCPQLSTHTLILKHPEVSFHTFTVDNSPYSIASTYFPLQSQPPPKCSSLKSSIHKL